MRIFDIYLVRRYVLWLGIVAGVLGGLIFLGDFVEMLRFASSIGKGAGDALYYSGLRFPLLLMDFTPFIILFATMFCLLRLSESQELVALRMGGLSIWRILLPFLMSSLLISIMSLVLFEPLGTDSYRKFYKIEQSRGQVEQQITLSASGIWLRDETADGPFIMQAGEFIDHETNLLGNVWIFKFDASGKFTHSLYAQRGQLSNGIWQLQQVTKRQSGQAAVALARVSLPTNLTPTTLNYNFHSPRTLNLRQLADYIALGERTGLNVTFYKIRYHALLSSPFSLLVMVLIAACFALPTGRVHKTAPLLALTTLSGFAIFVVDNSFKLIALQGLLLPLVASWAAQIIAALLAISLLLRQEDG